jgi:fluoroquinolone transport system permease protein
VTRRLPGRSRAVTRRVGALLTAELRTQWRQRIPVAVLALAAAWSGLLALVPAGVARVAAPYLLFLEIMTVGTLFAGALTVTDRSTGATAALGVSPARAWERVAARLAPLALLTTAAAVPVLIASRGGGRIGTALATTGLAGLLLLAVATAVAAGRDEFVGFLVALSGPVALLFAAPLAVAAGLLSGALWYAAPTTGALALLRADSPYPAGRLLGYLALWAAAAVGCATWRLRSGREPAPGRGARRLRPLPTRPRWLVLPRADLRNITRDTMLALVALSPLLLALALRLGYPPLAGWLHRTRGVELAPYAPVLALLAVAVHVPVSYGMTGALIVLEDRESGTLAVVRTSPLGLPRYLAYRLAAVALLSAAGVAVAAPLSGLVPASAAGALLLAVPLGPLVTVATLAVARTRVQGAAAEKLLALPAYLPLAAWWLTGPAGWLLAPLPTYWVARSWSGADPPHLLAGVACLTAWLVPLTRRAARRLR